MIPSMPEIRALIFDMDGVIVNSNPVHREAWEVYNRRHGIETTEAMHQRMYGKRNDQIVRDFFGAELPADDVSAHGLAKEALYRDMILPAFAQSLVPGLRSFIERHRNCKVGLGTNAEPLNVDFVLREAGIADLFQAIVDGHQVEHAKPAPDIYLKVAATLAVSPANCVVFEDSFSGVAAARAAGMRVIGIRTTHQEFQGVELAVDDFTDPQLDAWIELA
jgi:beta-phosphoglucomutase